MKILNSVVFIEGFTHNDVLIKKATFITPIKITETFEKDKPIGMAELRKVGGVVYADIDVNDEFKKAIGIGKKEFFPYIGGQIDLVTGEIKIDRLAIGLTENADKRIKPLKIK